MVPNVAEPMVRRGAISRPPPHPLPEGEGTAIRLLVGSRVAARGNELRGYGPMPITVELTYDMSKALGVERFQVEAAQTVDDVVRLTRERFGAQATPFEQLARV